MAVNHIQTTKTNPYIQRLMRISAGLKTNMEDLQDFVTMLSLMKDAGVVTQYMVDQLQMPSLSAAQALVAETESLSSKIDSDATVDHVQTAINQLYNKIS